MPPDLQGELAAHRHYLLAIVYRLTGSIADAEDIVQETLTRAWAKPPPDTTKSMRSWLTTVAMNLGRDALRRRRRQRYVGPWLPEPLDADHPAVGAFEPAVAGESLEGRYDLLESVRFAFLLALEALTPAQRAVLVLRDVFDYTASETGAALDMSPERVRVTHLRARRRLADYDATRELSRSSEKEVVEAFLVALAEQDIDKIERLLADDVVATNDGGAEYFSAKKPVVGAKKVAKLYAHLAQRRGAPAYIDVRRIHDSWALIARFADAGPRESKLSVTLFDTRDGRIARIYSALIPEKLIGVSFDAIR